MDATVAALLGAAIGGVLSVLASWIAQRVQSRSQWLVQEIKQRQQLYSEFVEASTRCFASALQQNELDASRIAKLYGEIGRMRLYSTEAVIREAFEIARKILEAYADDNRTMAEVRDMLEHGSIDLFASFSEACRIEFANLEPASIVRLPRHRPASARH